MLGHNIDINLKPTSDILAAAALLDVRHYFNERDLLDLRTYGYQTNDTFLMPDYDEATANAKTSADIVNLNNSNFIIFNRTVFGRNDSNNDSGTITISSPNDVSAINGNASVGLPMPEDVVVLLKMISMSIVLGLMILITIIGNVFVIAAIILERNLQNVANYLVVSLAVADLFVACLVMPLGAVYEISEGWILGPELCDIWTSCDVLCCTASILHLVAIATD
ncbi:5-hydroxytryptamine receptor 2B-like, partial [Musca vetustissima]|uniref:5-hydroxytryptamine receptor 2B-like n=1 Tax=Musca vetustissima TaxID=27455 RepID=UPI002AB73D73